MILLYSDVLSIGLSALWLPSGTGPTPGWVISLTVMQLLGWAGQYWCGKEKEGRI